MSKVKATPNRYLIDPPVVQDRVDEEVYARVREQTAKWTPVDHMVKGCGNVRPNWNNKTKKFVFKDPNLNERFSDFYKTHTMFHDVISSALLLYRLLCLYKATVETEGPEGYKCTWWVTLKHNETGELLTFGDWKGAAGTWTRFHKIGELPKSYRDDTLLLLNEICSPDCPHPYDGCVAGSVA